MRGRVAFGVVAGILLVAASALGQAPVAASTPAAAAANLTFDVASIRPSADLRSPAMQAAIRAGNMPKFGALVEGLRAEYSQMTLKDLVANAYEVKQYQVSGSDVLNEQRFDIVAKMPEGSSKDDAPKMLRALLEERFKLKTHWETREGDTYNLVVAKGGPKLGAEGSMPPSEEELKNFGDHPVPTLRQKGDHGLPEWVGNACRMGDLASIMGAMFGRPVMDKTGLAGKYDFVLKYKGRWDSDRQADDMDPTPPMDRALQEELGLKVEPAKGPVKVLVIDHIEKPSEN